MNLPEAPPPRSRMKLLLAAVLGFLLVLIAAGFYIYANWPRPRVPVAAVPPSQLQQAPPAEPVPPQPVTQTAPAPEQTVAPAPAPVPVQHPHVRPAKPPSEPAMPVTEQAPPQQPQEQVQSEPQPEPQPPPQAEPQPAPAPRPAAPAMPVYSGARSGWLTWSGKLGKNETLTIDGATASTGHLTGELPGVPVNVVVDVTNIGLDEEPSPRNQWKRLVLRSLGKHDVIRVHWTVK